VCASSAAETVKGRREGGRDREEPRINSRSRFGTRTIGGRKCWLCEHDDYNDIRDRLPGQRSEQDSLWSDKDRVLRNYGA